MTSIRPFRVGHESVIVVGMGGVVEAISDDGITIGGITLPNRLDHDRGVRYVSMVWPEGDETTCNRDHCGPMCDLDVEPADNGEREDLEDLVAIAVRLHDGGHPGALPFCEHILCREINDRGLLA